MTRPTLLITGAAGFVGGHVLLQALDVFSVIGADIVAPPMQHPHLQWRQIEMTDENAVRSLMQTHRPQAVIHTAAISDIDLCEVKPDLADRNNLATTQQLAVLCRQFGGKLVFTSTDTVFDGENVFYTEDDPPRPVNHYGETKAAAERVVMNMDADFVIARLSWVLGLPAFGLSNSFLAKSVQSLQNGETIAFPDDEFRTPVSVYKVAQALLALTLPNWHGIFHLAGNERKSRYETAHLIAQKWIGDGDKVIVKNSQELGGRAKRPKDVSLSNEKASSRLNMDFLNIPEALEEIFIKGKTSHG